MSHINTKHFFSLLGRVTNVERLSPAELKSQFVLQFTNSRTDSLHQMTPDEYRTMVRTLEQSTGYASLLSRRRGHVLGLLERLGIPTSNRGAVNAYLANPRLATYYADGRTPKPFAHLSAEELTYLSHKLHKILETKSL